MKMLWRCSLVGLALGSVEIGSLARGGEAPPRLFPDLVQRYSVGAPQAQNPPQQGEGPKAVTAADLDGDGAADVIVGNLDGSVSVLLGRREGGLREQLLTPPTGLLTNASLRAVVVADFNRDGRLDVAAADIYGRSIVTLLGAGGGTLWPAYRTGIGPARALAAGDFNEDGLPDLLVACSPPDCDQCIGCGMPDRFLCILAGRGDGSFEAPQYLYTPGTTACFYDVAAADLDEDGHLDAVALDYSRWQNDLGRTLRQRRVIIFGNQGQGKFTTDRPQTVLEPAGQGPRAFCLAYLDEQWSDGAPPPGAKLDVIVANRDSATLDVFVNQGGLQFSGPTSFAAGDSPRDVAAGDLDGDGWLDLVVVNRNVHTISVLPGLGDGQMGTATQEYPTGVSPRQVLVRDFDGDGSLDVVVANLLSEDISLFKGQRGLQGLLLPEGYYPAGYSPISVATADFNGDGLPDVATANLRSHDVRVRLSQPGGVLGPETSDLVNYGPAFLASGDLNGDGKPDLVVSCLGSGSAVIPQQRAALVTLLGRGDGSFQAPVATALNSVVSQPYWLRLGDLSGDGVLDAAVGGVNGALALFRGRGDGSFEPGRAFGFRPDGRPLGLALGDFDRDGRLDIATSRGAVFLNDGQFFRSPPPPSSTQPDPPFPGRIRTFNSGSQAWAVEAEDLDGDGVLA